jgi:hypothetical protein
MKGDYYKLLNKGWNPEKMCQNSWPTPLQLELSEKLLKEIPFPQSFNPEQKSHSGKNDHLVQVSEWEMA